MSIIANKAVRRSLILAGGGMRLAYQAGVLIALEEAGHIFDHIDGTSGGIFNTAMLASGLSPHAMAERWRNLPPKYFMSGRPLKNYLKPMRMKGYADADNIRNKVFPMLGIDVKKIRANKSAAFTFNVCNFSDKSVVAVPQDKATAEHLIAGISLPMMMPGIKIGDNWYSDAVWIKDANLTEAVRRGAKELWLIWAIGNTRKYLPGMLNQYVHMIEMSANGGLLEEYEKIAALHGKTTIIGKKNGMGPLPRLYVIKPATPLPLDPDLFFGKINMRSLINIGYDDAKRSLDVMPKSGFAMDKNATAMQDLGTRLTFYHEFRGILSNKKQQVAAGFYPCFEFSMHGKRSFMRICASIRIEGDEHERPVSAGSLRIKKYAGKSWIDFQGSCNCFGKPHSFNASWIMTSPLDLLMGLSCKAVKLSIHKPDENLPIFHGILYQDIKSRLKGIVNMSYRDENVLPGGFIKKYRMAKNLCAYEI